MLFLTSKDNKDIESFKRFNIDNWDEVKQRITYKVINKKAFALIENCKNIIHEDNMDLSKVFMITELSHNREELECYLLTSDDCHRFNKTKKEIISIANHNVENDKKRRIKSFREDVINVEALAPIATLPENSMIQIPGNSINTLLIDDECDQIENIITVTNKYNVFGSSYMLDFNTLNTIRERFNDNFYIIPLSVHKFMCIKSNFILKKNPNREEVEDDLLDMIYKINIRNKNSDDILSYRLYYYSIEDGEKLISIKQQL